MPASDATQAGRAAAGATPMLCNQARGTLADGPPADSAPAADGRGSVARGNGGTVRADGPGVADRDLPIVYLDSQLAVVSKPAGLMVHDSALARGECDFAADRLRAQFARPVFLVHRLDRATSGCLLLAFDRETASRLGKALMAGEVSKQYLAVCRGWPAETFTIDHALDGGPGKPLKKPAVTDFARLATAELDCPSAGFATSRYALLQVQPRTGRFRQIRRHLKHASHHLIGDSSHGDGRHNRAFRALGIHRMLLHAQRLSFLHPGSGARVDAQAPVDTEFARALSLFDAPGSAAR